MSAAIQYVQDPRYVYTTQVPTSYVQEVQPVHGVVIEGAECDVTPGNHTPWPSIIVILVGILLVLYTAIGSKINTYRKLFGIVMLLIWTIVWAFILFMLWKDCHHAASWWLLFIPISGMTIFFVLIILMNL